MPDVLARDDDELMGGRRQPRTRRMIPIGQDADHVYEAACIDLADSLGYAHEEVCGFWSQVALAREWAGQPRAVAEWMALRDVRWALDFRGRQPD